MPDITNTPFRTPDNSPFSFPTSDHGLFPTADRGRYNELTAQLRQQYTTALAGIRADVQERGASQTEYEFAVSQLREQYQNQLDRLKQEWQMAVDRANQN
ncbi:hypothetical protein ACFXKC_30130 [Streptomyces sp. NPDC059340]|uniref:hypothetical protein n=1 Tax=Streptomyces sp. NPDC059340 TaxID=3346806 RepID=UPI0036B96AA9